MHWYACTMSDSHMANDSRLSRLSTGLDSYCLSNVFEVRRYRFVMPHAFVDDLSFLAYGCICLSCWLGVPR